MNDHDPFDDLDDPRLASALGALAPASEVDAYPGAHRRFVQRRRRHRLVTAGAGVATAAAAIVLVVALNGGSSGISGVRTVNPAAHGNSTVPSTPTPSGTSGGTAGTSTSTSTPSVIPPPAGSTASTTPTTATAPLPTSPTSAPAREETVDSAGGSIRVRIAGTTVQLLSSTPAAGYAADVRASGPTEVEVRFRMGSSGKDEHRIRLRFDSAGVLQREIS